MSEVFWQTNLATLETFLSMAKAKLALQESEMMLTRTITMI